MPAAAADLGGNCCADLEERVAELEATTARKGNRKVSLEVSGWVHQGIMWFDGAAHNNSTSTQVKESNAYVVNRPESNSRFRFVGKAAINAKMSAGYLMEIQVNTANSDSVNAANDDGSTATSTSPANANTLSVRHSAWWIEHKDMGKVWVGQTSQATDGITEIQLSNTGHIANSNITAGGALLAVNKTGGTNRSLFNFMGGTSTDNSQIGEGNRRNLVKYESPALAGFILSAAAGEDDIWDVALRYAGEFSGFKLAFGIGYERTTEGGTAATTGNTGSERNCIETGGTADVKCEQLGLSGSVMHAATGLFVNGYYGQRKDDVVGFVGQDDTSTRWGINAGIEKNWTGLGKTTVFGEYHNWQIGANNVFKTTTLAGAEMTMWGVGINQSIDAAAMDLYIQYRNYDDISTIDSAGKKTDFNSIQMLYAGGMIKF